MERKEFTPAQIAKIRESAMSSARASCALEGMYISDANFEKIKAMVDELEKTI